MKIRDRVAQLVVVTLIGAWAIIAGLGLFTEILPGMLRIVSHQRYGVAIGFAVGGTVGWLLTHAEWSYRLRQREEAERFARRLQEYDAASRHRA